jgi:type II secretory pathway component PulK
MWNVDTQAGNCSCSRRGVVLIVVVVVFTISLSLFGLWAKAAIKQHQRSRQQQLRLQAVRLVEAGVNRAIARRAASDEFREETWVVPADELDRLHTAEVRIRITHKDNGSALSVEATADFPAGVTRKVRITRRVDLPQTVARSEP